MDQGNKMLGQVCLFVLPFLLFDLGLISRTLLDTAVDFEFLREGHEDQDDDAVGGP